MKRVVLTGPESTGKSSLGKQLSLIFDCSLVNEYARQFIEELNRAYTQSDLSLIAQGQLNSEKKNAVTSNLSIGDTDLLTIKVWSDYQYGNCDPWIVEQLKNNLPDLYLICYPDLKWEYDPLRENPNDGLELFNIYLSEIEELGIPFKIIKGKGQERIENAEKAIDQIII